MKALKRLFLLVFVLIFLAPLEVLSADLPDFASSPRTNNGQKWRIGYYEGGEYIDYQKIFGETVKGLMKLG
jgi:hypothetical protein